MGLPSILSLITSCLPDRHSGELYRLVPGPTYWEHGFVFHRNGREETRSYHDILGDDSENDVSLSGEALDADLQGILEDLGICIGPDPADDRSNHLDDDQPSTTPPPEVVSGEDAEPQAFPSPVSSIPFPRLPLPPTPSPSIHSSTTPPEVVPGEDTELQAFPSPVSTIPFPRLPYPPSPSPPSPSSLTSSPSIPSPSLHPSPLPPPQTLPTPLRTKKRGVIRLLYNAKNRLMRFVRDRSAVRLS